ncbi:hypothetical protein [Pseudomonas sp. p1(2021b)]|uniref:hypothetical protein n=1 Tax=Pseudomonas sp. p1(2021b) TaxID=2874628 RepID=UPI003D2AB47E
MTATTKTKSNKPAIPRSSSTMMQLMLACKRAGTVEVLRPLKGSVSALMALHEVVKIRSSQNFAHGKDMFHVCHIAPVTHGEIIGTFCAENLFVAAGHRNKAAGNSYVEGAGEYIARSHLKAQWKVSDRMTEKAVMDLLIKYVGEATLEKFAKKAKLQESSRTKLIAEILQCLHPLNKQHREWKEIVENPSTKIAEISRIHQEVTGKRIFVPTVARIAESHVAIKELARIAPTRVDLETLLPAIEQAFLHGKPSATLSTEALDLCFQLMMGHDLATFDEEALQALVSQLEAPSKAAVARHEEMAKRAQIAEQEATERAIAQHTHNQEFIAKIVSEGVAPELAPYVHELTYSLWGVEVAANEAAFYLEQQAA